jgi:predicted nucleic-acid-binding Zn-ribbon protein
MTEWRVLADGREERIPYEWCPNCGECQYREVKKYTSTGLFWWMEIEEHHWMQCKNCKMEDKR